jgi:hypothetical protein
LAPGILPSGPSGRALRARAGSLPASQSSRCRYDRFGTSPGLVVVLGPTAWADRLPGLSRAKRILTQADSAAYRYGADREWGNRYNAALLPRTCRDP